LERKARIAFENHAELIGKLRDMLGVPVDVIDADAMIALRSVQCSGKRLCRYKNALSLLVDISDAMQLRSLEAYVPSRGGCADACRSITYQG
jgi:hypothetical protein